MLVRNLLKTTIATVTLLLAGGQTINNSIGRHTSAIAQGKPKVVASYSILCQFLDRIAEETIDLTCLMAGGVDPHTYRPTPSQRKALEEARVIFYGGYDFEPQIISLIEAVDDDIPKIAVHEAVVTDPILAEGHHHGEHGHGEHHGEHEDHGHGEHGHGEHEEHGEKAETAELAADPHIWHDVYNAIATIEYLQSTLLQLNPQQAALYLENSASLVEELKQLHVWVQEQIATIPEGQRILVTTHDALNYYVNTYEFDDYHTLQGLSPDDSPSASDLKELVGEIRQTQVPTIFAEATSNNRVINNVAREAGVELSDRQLVVDGLGETGTNTDTYSKMMVHNTCAIVDGLGGSCQKLSLK